LVLISVGMVVWVAQRYQSLAASLERERTALAESIETRAALLRGITHDVKNPLGAAAGYADLLADGIAGGPLTPQQLTMVRRIRKLLGDSLTTISDLLHLERDSAGDAGAVQTIDLNALVTELVDDYRAAALEKSLTIELEASHAPLVARTQATHVRHIVGNLLSNAVKYTPPHGSIHVMLANEPLHNGGPQLARIEVRDSGAGIPKALRDRVFEEFYRADSANGTAGHGVGLAISRRFARILGGDVTVGEAPEGGAKFTLLLPLDSAKRSAAV
jgi:signal transduction histidine kinase